MKINRQKVSDYFSTNKWWIGLVFCLILLPFAVAFHKAWLLIMMYLPEASLLMDTFSEFSYDWVCAGAMGFASMYIMFILLDYYYGFARSLIAFFKHFKQRKSTD